MAVPAEQISPALTLWEWARDASFEDYLEVINEFWSHPRTTNADLAEYAALDRFFLLVFILQRHDACRPWLYDRCREVQRSPDDHLDLWARYHYKSTLITFAGIIQEIINNPNITVGIFSLNNKTATSFLSQIKREFETNELLKELYPHIFYAAPEKESPKWSEQVGIIVKRDGNRRECTVEANGLIDSLPVSKHYDLRVYDDVVTEKSVTTPDMVEKVTERFELSQSLGTEGGRKWMIGTRYAFGDTYAVLIQRGTVKERRYPATDDGTINGKPVFLSQDEWDTLLRDTSLYTIACQQLLNPREGAKIAFDPDWIHWWEIRPRELHVYVMVDPARTKKKTSDHTGIAVVGIDHAFNKFVLDGLLHRLSLSERWGAIKYFRNKWLRAPGVRLVEVGYEKYGAEADFDYFNEQMQIDEQVFTIRELTWNRDAPDSHVDRVQRLEPDLRNARLYWPVKTNDNALTRMQREAKERGQDYLIARPIMRKDEDSKIYDLVDRVYQREYLFFPNIHVDWLDALSRMYDMGMTRPIRRSTSDLMLPAEPSY